MPIPQERVHEIDLLVELDVDTVFLDRIGFQRMTAMLRALGDTDLTSLRRPNGDKTHNPLYSDDLEVTRNAFENPRLAFANFDLTEEDIPQVRSVIKMSILRCVLAYLNSDSARVRLTSVTQERKYATCLATARALRVTFTQAAETQEEAAQRDRPFLARIPFSLHTVSGALAFVPLVSVLLVLTGAEVYSTTLTNDEREAFYQSLLQVLAHVTSRGNDIIVPLVFILTFYACLQRDFQEQAVGWQVPAMFARARLPRQEEAAAAAADRDTSGDRAPMPNP